MIGRRLPLLLGLVALCGACAKGGDFPSLAPRAVERLSFDEPEREAPVIASDPALSARVETLVAQARNGQTDFTAMDGAAESAVARSGAAGSESWVAAQQALSRLQAARRETVAALADLDALAIERANLPTNSQDMGAIAHGVETVAALARAQQQRIDSLKSRIAP